MDARVTRKIDTTAQEGQSSFRLAGRAPQFSAAATRLNVTAHCEMLLLVRPCWFVGDLLALQFVHFWI